MSQFTVTGRFQTRDGFAEFETTIEAENENVAREHAYAELGSQHNLKRTQIELEDVVESEEVTA
ncbi:50S ribosomal protein L18Ae [Halopiger xanaduensis]|uniref:Large ribosomal subunit protein eL20 n=1 Tax=Halopiger xanaduensis (strain DSM 18323 / JCM 14033 / SH-6) TaxID=797210 RepID=F8DBV6_HALXS|nr:50S ribosomal protein L18Ae [Halopiger xanaduensis]AEH35932.1 Ribosomal LX protein [Halopiger xanaduensis SH-6]